MNEQCLIAVRHQRQLENWDCGLACIAMILDDTKRAHYLRNLDAVCRDEGVTKSTWTIDLCFILERYGIPYKFFTKILGVHKGHKALSFYHHVYNEDEIRINQRFKTALKRSMRIYQSTIDLQSILRHLINGPIIVLTNARLLTCRRCKTHSNSQSQLFTNVFNTYQGHYVVLVGFHLLKRVIYYRNPASYDHVCAMSLVNLESARSAFGTDCDIIFINPK